MLAERRVALFETALLFDLKIKLVDSFSECLLVHIDEDAADLRRVKLLMAEGVHDNFARD